MEVILRTIWLLLPAYTPNNFAVIFGGGKPLDFGRKFIDGRRILGDGKTIRGFFGGFIGGILIAHIQILIERFFKFSIYSSLGYSEFTILIILLSLGSMVGDSFGSFIKRRLGFERGKSLPVVDQLTFLMFAYAFASLSPQFPRLFTFDVIVVGIFITPILHILVNVMAYKLNLKDVWW